MILKNININSSKLSTYKNTKKYYGNYLGIVIQNNDPEKCGKVKVWVPHVSPSVYYNWDDNKEDKSFNFVGKNIDSDLSDIIEELKSILPWANCAAPLNGSNASGRYNCYDDSATISDSNNKEDHDFDEDYVKTKYGLNDEGIGEKPGKKYEIEDLKLSDGFTDLKESKFEYANKYGWNYTPSTYSNSTKGSFSIPNVGCHVWVFFEDGDPTSPVYFAVSYGEEDWKSVYDIQDYPGAFENKSSTVQGEYNHNTETYRNKYLINQKGGVIEIVNTDNRELLKFTHYSGSFKEFSNYVNTELAINNDQKLVQNDQFITVKGNRSIFVKRDLDSIVKGDRYYKTGNLNYSLFQEYKSLFDSVADAKQLFDIKRATTIPAEGFLKKTSINQQRSGTFDLCPLCSSSERGLIWENKYTFNKVTPNIYDNNTNKFNFEKGVSSEGDDVFSELVQPSSPGSFLGGLPCPVCGGSGESPSSYNGEWEEEDKATLITQRFNFIKDDITKLEKQMGLGGNEIVCITKNKIENIGLVLNDFPSIRVDDVGKIDIDQILVFDKGVVSTFKERPLFEYTHVDDLPGGTKIDNINNKWNVQVGSGGISIKTLGGVDVGGSITNITGQQTNIVSEEELNLDAKNINISAEILLLRNKNSRQVVVDGNLGVNNNVVVGGSMHVEGEVSLHHITAPMEIQETEPIVCYGRLVGGRHIGNTRRGDRRVISVDTPMTVILYQHTHPFRNLPLKLAKTKDDVRRLGKISNETDRGQPIPVMHERKIEESVS